MKLDLHNLTVEEAADEIFYKFYECAELGEIRLELVHGYKHSTTIKDYIIPKNKNIHTIPKNKNIHTIVVFFLNS